MKSGSLQTEKPSRDSIGAMYMPALLSSAALFLLRSPLAPRSNSVFYLRDRSGAEICLDRRPMCYGPTRRKKMLAGSLPCGWAKNATKSLPAELSPS
jgi:hypothetical protein